KMGKHNYFRSHLKRSYKRGLVRKEKRKEVVEVLKNQLAEKKIIEVEDKEVIEISDDTSEEESKEKSVQHESRFLTRLKTLENRVQEIEAKLAKEDFEKDPENTNIIVSENSNGEEDSNSEILKKEVKIKSCRILLSCINCCSALWANSLRDLKGKALERVTVRSCSELIDVGGKNLEVVA
ncbi:8359_t:CDS:2, partial [Gigaspora margarita]